MAGTAHDKVEKNLGLLLVLTFLVISVGALVEIVPLFFQKSTTEPVAGLKPYTALQLEGRDVYVREGCYLCHSQMIRPFRAETERYGHYSVAVHLINPRDVVPESVMPGYPWLAKNVLSTDLIRKKMTVLRTLGHPYSDEEIKTAPDDIQGKTEMDAMIAYLQVLGTALKTTR
jgi:cytochrome c oxidase cbb3-type subunit 2